MKRRKTQQQRIDLIHFLVMSMMSLRANARKGIYLHKLSETLIRALK